jgi:small nuclear ribonucleoprotein (snRNP)-like protein
MIHEQDLWDYQGKRVRVTYKDGRKIIGVLQRDATDRCWALLRADAKKTKGQPQGIGEILFLSDIESLEEFVLKGR